MTSKKPIMSRLFSRQIPPIILRLSLPPLHGHQLEHDFEAVVPEGGDEAQIKGPIIHVSGYGKTLRLFLLKHHNVVLSRHFYESYA